MVAPPEPELSAQMAGPRDWLHCSSELHGSPGAKSSPAATVAVAPPQKPASQVAMPQQWLEMEQALPASRQQFSGPSSACMLSPQITLPLATVTHSSVVAQAAPRGRVPALPVTGVLPGMDGPFSMQEPFTQSRVPQQ